MSPQDTNDHMHDTEVIIRISYFGPAPDFANLRGWLWMQTEVMLRDLDHSPEAGMSFDLAIDRAYFRGGLQQVSNDTAVGVDAGILNS